MSDEQQAGKWSLADVGITPQGPARPSPASLDLAAPKGVCDQCGKPLTPREAWWYHPECMDDYVREWNEDAATGRASLDLPALARETADALDASACYCDTMELPMTEENAAKATAIILSALQRVRGHQG